MVEYRTRTETLVPLTELSATKTWHEQGWNCTSQYYNQFPVGADLYDSPYKCRSMVDVVTPQFKKLSSRGQIINNPMNMVSEDWDAILGSRTHSLRIDQYTCTPKRWLTVTTSDMSGGFMPFRYSDSRLPDEPDCDSQYHMDEAVTNAYANISESSILAYAMLAESEKSLLSLKAIFQRTLKIIRAAKKFKLKQLRGEISLEELSNRWMEARYALRPLLYDAAGIIDVVYNNTMPVRQTYRGMSSSGYTVNDNYVTVAISYGGGFTGEETYRFSTSVEFVARAGVLTAVEDLGRLGKIGLADIAESAWELVPLSFVVDWFFNVGKTLAAWTPDYGFKHLASWLTTEKVVTKISDVVGRTIVNPVNTSTIRYYSTMTWAPARLTQVTTTKIRQPNPKRYLMPHLKVRLGTLKTLDLLKIGKQLIS